MSNELHASPFAAPPRSPRRRLAHDGRSVAVSVQSDGHKGGGASEFVTVADVAQDLRVTERFVRRLIASGELHAFKIEARVVRVRRKDVELLLRPVGGAARTASPR